MTIERLREEFVELLHAHVPSLRITGAKATGHVPWREDNHPSFSADLEKVVWYDLARKEGGGVKEFKARLGLNGSEKQQRTIVAVYPYYDEQKNLLYEVVRFDPKGFAQRRPDGNGGWLWNLDGVRRALYHQSEILSHSVVYLAEGEKDADRLWSIGLPATTCPGGAGKWRAEYAKVLRSKKVVILPDNDDPGEKHARDVARSLLPVAEAVKIVRLPGLQEKGDVSDWLDSGHSKEELAEIVKAAPTLRAEDLAEPPKAKESDNPWTLAKSAPDFLAEAEEEFEGLAKDLLAPGAITLLAAPRGLGKTQTSHALAVALATGGRFRGEQVRPVRVLLLDRDNPETPFKQSLRAWGAAKAPNLRVLTRQNAPDLKDKKTWEVFPIDEYDVLIVDSVGAATEGVTEKEGRQTTEILSTILDLARQGLAILLLANCTKDALNVKGRGEWSDRADILYEVRDATGFISSGKKPWWQELPEAGEAAWAERAARRKGQIDFRLAFIASKFRLGPEPEPFCIELHLPKGEPWTLRDVTADILKAGEDALAQGERAKEERLKKAAEALAKAVSDQAAKGSPMLKTEAEQFLCEELDLRRSEARQMLKDSSLWRLENRRQGEGKQAAWCVLPKNGGDGDDAKNPRKMGVSEDQFVAAQAGSGRQRQVSQKAAIDAGFQSTNSLPPKGCKENPGAGNDLEKTYTVWEETYD